MKSFSVPVKEKKQIFLSLEWESDKVFCQRERKKDKRVKEGFIRHRIEVCDKMKVFCSCVKKSEANFSVPGMEKKIKMAKEGVIGHRIEVCDKRIKLPSISH